MPLVYYRIINEPIDIRFLEAKVSEVTNGAVLTFIGQVRVNSRGREVSYLEYDAYVPLAEKQIGRITKSAAERWQVDVAVEHRFGRIELGEASIVICVGAPHRDVVYEASRYLIDTIKEEVPIWKREVCPDGDFWIEGEEAIRASEA